MVLNGGDQGDMTKTVITAGTAGGPPKRDTGMDAIQGKMAGIQLGSGAVDAPGGSGGQHVKLEDATGGNPARPGPSTGDPNKASPYAQQRGGGGGGPAGEIAGPPGRGGGGGRNDHFFGFPPGAAAAAAAAMGGLDADSKKNDTTGGGAGGTVSRRYGVPMGNGNNARNAASAAGGAAASRGVAGGGAVSGGGPGVAYSGDDRRRGGGGGGGGGGGRRGGGVNGGMGAGSGQRPRMAGPRSGYAGEGSPVRGPVESPLQVCVTNCYLVFFFFRVEESGHIVSGYFVCVTASNPPPLPSPSSPSSRLLYFCTQHTGYYYCTVCANFVNLSRYYGLIFVFL